MEKDINEPIKSMMDRAYNQALNDLWKLAISKFDETMDFTELKTCIEELKKN